MLRIEYALERGSLEITLTVSLKKVTETQSQSMSPWDSENQKTVEYEDDIVAIIKCCYKVNNFTIET